MNEHAGHRSRLRENFIQNGIEGMADHQVLELLLTYAIPRKDTNPIAHGFYVDGRVKETFLSEISLLSPLYYNEGMAQSR